MSKRVLDQKMTMSPTENAKVAKSFILTVDLIGKGGHIRTVPIPGWAKAALDHWTRAAGVTEGRIFRAVARAGRCGGKGSRRMLCGT